MELSSDLAASHATMLFQQQQIVVLKRENEYLREQLQLLKHQVFGRSSEKRPVASSSSQLFLFTGKEEVRDRLPEKEKVSYTRTKPKRQEVEGKLPEGTRFPESLPRETTILEEGEGEVVFDKITERLAAHKSAFYVKRFVRRVRRTSAGGIEQPPVPSPVLERTTVDVTFLAFIVISKFVDHLPLYRQEQMMKRSEISISRDTLIRYVIGIASLVQPIYAALEEAILSEKHLFSDETPVLVGKGEKGASRYTKSYFWTFLGAAGALFRYTATRAAKEVESLLSKFKGFLQCDGYEVYEKLAAAFPEIVLVGCWAHARRKFTEAEAGGNSTDAKKALRFIRALYLVERRIAEQNLAPPEALKLRQRYSQRFLARFHRWLKKKETEFSVLPKSLFGKAVAYTLGRWVELNRYTDNADLAIDSNAIERQIRPVALGRKNWLFCASEVGAQSAAILYSLIASCKLADVDPFDYFVDVLERISVHPAPRVHDLIPRNWKFLRQQEASDSLS